MSEPTGAPPTSEHKGALLQSRDSNYKEIAIRIGVVLLNLLSIGLFWWSLQYLLLPLQKKARDASTAVTRLQSEVDAMERAWTKPASEEVRGKFGEVRNWMFVGQPAVEEWLGNVKKLAMPLALEVGLDFSRVESAEAAPTNAPSAIRPTAVALTFRSAPGIEAVASPYQRVLQLSQRLTTQDKRVDFTELTVNGGSNSVENAVIVLHLWTGEEGDLQ